MCVVKLLYSNTHMLLCLQEVNSTSVSAALTCKNACMCKCKEEVTEGHVVERR